MGPGQVGVPGQVHVNQLAENPEAEPAAIHIPCWVERIVLGIKMKSLQIFVMEGAVVQVCINSKILIIFPMIFLC